MRGWLPCVCALIVCGGFISQGSQFITKAEKSLKIAKDEFKVVNQILGI